MTRGALVAVLLTAPLAAQSHPVVDSAAAARAAWRRALDAESKGDRPRALAETRRAAAAWPEQPFYHEALALLSARTNDTTSLLQAVATLAALESGQRVLTDSAAGRLRAAPRVATALDSLARVLAARPRSREWARLADTTIYAEGLDADPGTGAIYVGSIRHRTIYRVTPDGAPPVDLAVNRWPGVGAILGVRFDTGRHLLWATTAGLPQTRGYRPADSTIAALLAIRPEDGSIVARYDLPSREPHLAGDLAIGPAGDVYVTDSRSPVVFILRPGATVLAEFRHPLFRSLQGVAPAPDGHTVFLADYSHGLLRWTPATGTITRVAMPWGASSLGLDGILLDGRRLYGIQNGVVPPRVVAFLLDEPGRRALALEVVDRHLPIADEPTILTRLGDLLVYVANSQWEKYDEAGGRRSGTTLAPTVLLSVPIAP